MLISSFFFNKILFVWWTELRFADRHLYLSLDCSILSVWNFQLCTKGKKKINPNLPIVVILFVKPVMINILNGYQYSVLLVAHQPFRQVFLFMNPNWILFCFIQWRCIFIPYFTVFFLSGLIKMIMNTAFFLDFFFFLPVCRCSFSPFEQLQFVSQRFVYFQPA